MKSDSETTKAKKACVRELIEVGFSIRLDDWFVDGVTIADLRDLQRIYRRAHERYMTEGVPTVKPLRFSSALDAAPFQA